MHLIIPFAFSSSEGCRAALRSFKLPQLEKLLARFQPEPMDVGAEDSLSTPHERALARALQLPPTDGQIPWAAQQAQAAGLERADSEAWAFITPCHWQTSAKQTAMSGSGLADFSAEDAQTLLAAMQPYCAEDAITLHYDQPERWLACGAPFAGLASASLDRVRGRSVASWMPTGPGAITLQRLQSEMQMLLYTHPVNEAREARGLPSVNSLWISGSGALATPGRSPATDRPVVVTTLRDAALREDWAAWGEAWQVIDSTECRALLAESGRAPQSQLTLCGERSSQSWVGRPRSLFLDFLSLFALKPGFYVLEQL